MNQNLTSTSNSSPYVGMSDVDEAIRYAQSFGGATGLGDALYDDPDGAAALEQLRNGSR